jgi:hypothetical protein
MCPDKHPLYHQAQLPLPKKTLWDRFPEPTRLRCRQLLIQLLHQVVLSGSKERSSDEREN